MILNRFFKNYYINLINAIFIIFAAFFYDYVILDKIDKYYYDFKNGTVINYNFNLFKRYIDYIFILFVVGLSLLLLSIITSKIIELSKREGKIIKFILMIIIIIYISGVTYRYLFLIKNLYNFKIIDYSELFYYFKKYLILNAITVLFICSLSLHILKIKNYMDNLAPIICVAFFILIMNPLNNKLTWESYLISIFLLFLANISLAFLEKKVNKLILENDNIMEFSNKF